ncbi:hypothetical protein Tco_0926996 [Tanacetum coccineum]|uniref:Uncharacterized protein n=1 Tax=Tanacetum coccineum TaxID=301880 RepID=A0ABQ5DCI6_9ASTR
MVAYLKKPSGIGGFQEIVDFLNGSHIRLLWHCMIVGSNELDVWKGFEVDCKTVMKSVGWQIPNNNNGWLEEDNNEKPKEEEADEDNNEEPEEDEADEDNKEELEEEDEEMEDEEEEEIVAEEETEIIYPYDEADPNN